MTAIAEKKAAEQPKADEKKPDTKPEPAPKTVSTTVPTAAPVRRMSLANVRKGTKRRPIRALVYGDAGVGKSTLGATAPSPIFLSTESGLDELDVASFPEPQSWNDALEGIGSLIGSDHEFQTLVIDSVDWLEKLLHTHVIATCPNNKDSMKSAHGGFMAAYEVANREWRRFLAKLELIWSERSMNIVLLSHAVPVKVENPVGDNYVMMRPALHDSKGSSSANLLIEWSYATVYLAREIFTRKAEGERAKGVGGTDVYAHTVGNAAITAKCRYKGVAEKIKISEVSGWSDLFGSRSVAETRGSAEIVADVHGLIEKLPEAQREKAQRHLLTIEGNIPELLKMLRQLQGMT